MLYICTAPSACPSAPTAETELNCQMLKAKGLSEKGVKDELVTRLARVDAGLPSLDEPTKQQGVYSGGGSGGGGGGGGGPIGTLVVCPMSVLSNWETQLKEHVKEGALKVIGLA